MKNHFQPIKRFLFEKETYMTFFRIQIDFSYNIVGFTYLAL